MCGYNNALEALPNTVIESGSVVCENKRTALAMRQNAVSYLCFTGNPVPQRHRGDYYWMAHACNYHEPLWQAGQRDISGVHEPECWHNRLLVEKEKEDVTVYRSS